MMFRTPKPRNVISVLAFLLTFLQYYYIFKPHLPENRPQFLKFNGGLEASINQRSLEMGQFMMRNKPKSVI